jgi:hypothetical protein
MLPFLIILFLITVGGIALIVLSLKEGWFVHLLLMFVIASSMGTIVYGFSILSQSGTRPWIGVALITVGLLFTTVSIYPSRQLFSKKPA